MGSEAGDEECVEGELERALHVLAGRVLAVAGRARVERVAAGLCLCLHRPLRGVVHGKVERGGERGGDGGRSQRRAGHGGGDGDGGGADAGGGSRGEAAVAPDA